MATTKTKKPAKKIERVKSFEYAGLHVPQKEDTRVLFAQFDSSNLQSLAYCMTTKTVYAVFKSSPEKRYVYLDVPGKLFFKVMAAESVGADFSKRIVKGGFKFFDEKNK